LRYTGFWNLENLPQMSISAQQVPRLPMPEFASLLDGFQPSTLAWKKEKIQSVEGGWTGKYENLQHRR
jgi:hypothetical protein